jgi:hypothetical protein
MTEIIVGIISGLGGVAVATIAARAQRPSRLRDIVDTSGELTDRLLKEIERLDKEVAEARADADEARAEARAARDEVYAHTKRIGALERVLRENGVDPASVNGSH